MGWHAGQVSAAQYNGSVTVIDGGGCFYPPRFLLMEEVMACTCGHAEEEHGHDPQYPGSTSCQIAGCDCVAFEDDGEDDDE